jgi:phage antirepressor YoqD-like protein
MQSTTSSIVKVQNTDLAPIVFNGERCITLAMIDKVHNKTGAARNNFYRNLKHFVKDAEFHTTSISNLRTQLKSNLHLKDANWQIPSAGRALTLLTQRGYYKLATTFEDDLSWKIRDEVMDGYFHAKKISEAVAAIAVPSPVSLVEALSNPVLLREALLNFTDQVIALQTRVQEMKPKESAFDYLMDDCGGLTLDKAAKTLKTGSKRLFRLLRSRGYLRKDNIPYQRFIEEGLFKLKVKTTTINQKEGPNTQAHAQTLITGKGLGRFQSLFFSPQLMLPQAA